MGKNTLTDEEIEQLLMLVKESSNTGNEEWDATMKSIEKKLKKQILNT